MRLPSEMPLEALLLDLDGTLIHNHQSAFLDDYASELAEHFRPIMPPDEFKRCLLEATDAMCASKDGSTTNEEVFYRDFLSRARRPREIFDPVFEHYYEVHFPQLKRHSKPKPEARNLLWWARGAGLKVVLATNPIFPLGAVIERLTWGRIDDFEFDLITALESMHFCKPQPEYYLEISSMIGVRPEHCLMAGNDVQEDMVAAEVGMRTFLVTDYILNRREAVPKTDGAGSLEDLLRELKRGALGILSQSKREK